MSKCHAMTFSCKNHAIWPIFENKSAELQYRRRTEWFLILQHYTSSNSIQFPSSLQIEIFDFGRLPKTNLTSWKQKNLAMLGLKNQNREKLRIFQNKQNEILWSTGPPEHILTGEDWPFKNGHSRGQLISKCPFGVIVWTKIPTKKFPRFLP